MKNMLEKAQAKLSTTKGKVYAVATAGTTALVCSPVMTFAAEDDTAASISTAIVSEFTSLKGEALIAMTAIVGIGLSIFGFKWVFKTSKSFFNQSAK